MKISIIYIVKKQTLINYLSNNSDSNLMKDLITDVIPSRIKDLSRATYNNVFEDDEDMKNHSVNDDEVQIIVKYENVDGEEIDNIVDESVYNPDAVSQIIDFIKDGNLSGTLSNASVSRINEIADNINTSLETEEDSSHTPDISESNISNSPEAHIDDNDSSENELRFVNTSRRLRHSNINNDVPSISVGEFLNRLNGIDRDKRIYISYYEEGNMMEAGIPQFKILEEGLINVDNETQKFPVGSIIIY